MNKIPIFKAEENPKEEEKQEAQNPSIKTVSFARGKKIQTFGNQTLLKTIKNLSFYFHDTFIEDHPYEDIQEIKIEEGALEVTGPYYI
jgi:hypothetical protein